MSDPLLPEKGFLILESWSTVHAVGGDVEKFLNSFCTNDLTKLESNEACEAFFTDVKAHILAYAFMLKISDTSFIIILSSAGANDLLAHLDRYLIREAVELNVGKEYLLFTTERPSSITAPRISITALGENAGVSLLRSESPQSIQDTIAEEGFSPIDPTAFEQARICRGVPFDQRDVNSENLPQEVDRIEQTINFHKGCYLGQEPVARIDALGQVNWLLRLLKVSGGSLKEGENLSHDGKVVVKIRSVTTSTQGSVALGYVRRQLAQEETEIDSKGTVVTIHTIA